MEKGKKLKQSEVNGVSRSVQFLDQVHLGEVILIQSNSETVIKLATLPGLLPEAYNLCCFKHVKNVICILSSSKILSELV